MKPTLFGYGKTTIAIAKSLGNHCTFYDDNCNKPFSDEYGNRIMPSHMFDPNSSQLEITTPSLPPQHPLIQKARNLLSEYDYFLSNKTGKKPFSIWISGTNGKTTTTQMLTHLLTKRGAVSGGNIGTPLAELSADASIWVLETSSFTLHHTHTASPDIYLLLPITPDHLNWHGSPQAYEADKLDPLTRMKEGQLALVPKGLKLPKGNAWVVEYDSDQFLEEFFDLDSSRLRYKAAFLQDALLSLAITRTLFDEADYDLINSFTLDKHRQEEIRDHLGRLWVNDSKATNADATVQAIKAYEEHKMHLILGGDDKGVDLNNLLDLIAKRDIALYTIGSNSDKLISMAKERNIEHYNCKVLDKAVLQIDKNMNTDEVTLLSPAASSLDQFKSYAYRGEKFIDLITKLSDA